jgi:glucan endo-1,3-beta-D-glucosidase
MRSSVLYAIAASLSSASAVYQGFNYGATKSDGTTPRVQADYEALFAQAKSLAGTNGAFSSARLYTMLVGYSSIIADPN